MRLAHASCAGFWKSSSKQSKSASAQAEASPRFVMNVSDSAREFLLMEGTDVRYGARPLKRAIERLLVQPMSNLIVTGQIRQERQHPGDSQTVGAASSPSSARRRYSDPCKPIELLHNRAQFQR